MSKMKFSQLLEMLQDSGRISVSAGVPKTSPQIGLEKVGLMIPEKSPLMDIATDFCNYHKSSNKDPLVAILLTEKARECWTDSIAVTYLEEDVYKKWSENKKKTAREEMVACGD